jgi:hypothetical protein
MGLNSLLFCCSFSWMKIKFETWFIFALAALIKLFSYEKKFPFGKKLQVWTQKIGNKISKFEFSDSQIASSIQHC